MKKIFIPIIIITFLLLHFQTFATTLSDYKSQQKTTNEEKQQAEEKLQNIKQEKQNTQEEVEKLNESISQVQAELSDLNDSINKLNETIKIKEKDLKEKEDLLEERLVVSYMNGNTTYLDALLSGGIINFISNYDTIKQIIEYDNTLINEVQKAKDELANNKAELEKTKLKVEENKSKLENDKKDREEKVKSLSAEEQAVQTKIEEKEQELAKINALVKAEQKRIEDSQKMQSNSGNGSNNVNIGNVSQETSGSMSWPTRIAHKVNSIYAPGGRTDTSGYVGTRHMGLDINAPTGTPIYAAQSGTVVYVNYSGYGGGWGLYVVIYHGTDSNGKAVYTRYAHASAIAPGISVGTKVTTNTVIMYAGATGAAEGAHLHFEVCLNNMYNQVSPCPYLGIPNARGTY